MTLLFFFTSFIATVAAIVLGIAFPGGRDATAVVASELGGVASDVYAARFVRRVATVVIRVTAERIGDAATRRALELVGGTGRFGAVLILIRIVQTVVVSVANPSFRNAPLVVARKIPNVGASLRQSKMN